MNDLHVGGTVWIAADIHLGPDAAATRQAFFDFLRRAALQADAVFLVGDVFDAWIGDDLALDAPPAWLADSLAALAHTARHIPLYIGRGNRDFLMGEALAEHLGARLLPDCVRLHTDLGAPLLLSHGDEYCTADLGYQRFRRIVRNPLIQRAFLALSLNLRRSIAQWARQRSRRGNQYKSGAIMDVHPAAIDAAFRACVCQLMVHGHTHRPAVHESVVDGRACRRIVLPDWDYEDPRALRGGWLSISRNELALHQPGSCVQYVPTQYVDQSASKP